MTQRDDFDDPEGRSAIFSIMSALDLRGRLPARGPLFTIVPLVALAAVLGGVLIYSYPKAGDKGGTAAVPTIHADATPYKAVPADPGGMEIPWQDSTVFDTLRTAKAGGAVSAGRAVENLLPEPEKPLPREELFAGLKPEITKETAAVVEEIPAVVEESAAVVEEAAPETVAASRSIPEAAAVAKVAGIEPAVGRTASAEAAKGNAYVQLGSVRSRADAQASWKTFQNAYPALAALTLRIEEADLGAKGKYYRVQAGPVTAEKAQSLCAAVTAKKPGGCLVVKH